MACFQGLAQHSEDFNSAHCHSPKLDFDADNGGETAVEREEPSKCVCVRKATVRDKEKTFPSCLVVILGNPMYLPWGIKTTRKCKKINKRNKWINRLRCEGKALKLQMSLSLSGAAGGAAIRQIKVSPGGINLSRALFCVHVPSCQRTFLIPCCVLASPVLGGSCTPSPRLVILMQYIYIYIYI